MDPIVKDFQFITGDLVGDPDRGFWTLKSSDFDSDGTNTLAILPNGNIVTAPENGNNVVITVLSPDGSIVASKQYSIPRHIIIQNICVTDDYLYVVGAVNKISPQTGTDYWFLKLNFDLSVVYSRIWPVGPNSYNSTFYGACARGPNTVYSGYYENGNNSQYPCLLTVDNTGAFINSRYFQYNSNAYGWEIKSVPNSTDVIMISSANIIRLNSSNGYVWNVPLPAGKLFSQIYVTESYVFFITGFSEGTTGIVQLRTDTGVQVSTYYTDTIDFYNISGYGNNIFVSGSTNGPVGSGFTITKFTCTPISDGIAFPLTQSYSRSVALSSFGYQAPAIQVFEDNVYVISSDSASKAIKLIKLPANGSILGTYTSAFSGSITISPLSLNKLAIGYNTFAPASISSNELSSTSTAVIAATPSAPPAKTTTKRTF